MTVAVAHQTDSAGDFVFTDKDFRMIADLANARYGLFLQPSKKALVYSRLAKRLRALDLPDFGAYCKLLDHADGAAEETHLLSALTTNVTNFFREMHHFEFLKAQIGPDLLRRAQDGECIRLWSSACSAGQEAYCMAATLLEVIPNAPNFDIRVLATDIDAKVVAQARRGQYPVEQLSAIPADWQGKMLAKNTSATDFTMRDDLRELITFGELNLMKDWPMRRKFDVIFCRNAAIYFDKTTQSRLWQRFAHVLAPGGHLMIGHSEQLCGPAQDQLTNVGITTYQKTAGVAGSDGANKDVY